MNESEQTTMNGYRIGVYEWSIIGSLLQLFIVVLHVTVAFNTRSKEKSVNRIFEKFDNVVFGMMLVVIVVETTMLACYMAYVQFEYHIRSRNQISGTGVATVN